MTIEEGEDGGKGFSPRDGPRRLVLTIRTGDVGGNAGRKISTNQMNETNWLPTGPDAGIAMHRMRHRALWG